ncbi:hypothetical protein SERLA73DRAFT_129260 [Serpula lacrymans var. lacrymans S7.3]|uniref:Uncharacterized protein n=2 Tax=Serpula lacrymans var. lacrymans TaxID=341189 RepID=F8PG16_SERL3|nr:uncharacterized protein SERLADRAFT_377001 [Serpula lacrymans var. lacrymans S7.9]EGO05351.1 hypothetical protein SERLA73DRAFT_129260 [Serpula lacrymans var. lacrymans S7.3]EGO31202.1 hypothetical protein SERLADRAFT_377001 [Serpula lacrymans var. lacrymans S7.9]
MFTHYDYDLQLYRGRDCDMVLFLQQYDLAWLWQCLIMIFEWLNTESPTSRRLPESARKY